MNGLKTAALFILLLLTIQPGLAVVKEQANFIDIDWDSDSICQPDIAGLAIPKTEIQSSITGHAKHVIRQSQYARESDTIAYTSIGATSSELTTDSTDFDVTAKSTTTLGAATYTYDKSYITQGISTFDQEVGTYYTTQNLNATIPALPSTAKTSLSHDNFLRDAAITTDLDVTTDLTSNGQPTKVTQSGVVTDNTGEGQAHGASFIEVSADVRQSIGNLNVTDNVHFRDYTMLIDELQYKYDNYVKLTNNPDGIKIKNFNTTITQQ